MENKIEFTNTLTKDDVIALTFHAANNRGSFRFLKFAVPAVLLLIILVSIQSGGLPQGIEPIVFLLVFLIILLPLVMYYSSIKEYKSNNRIKESVIYEIDKNQIHAKSDSFDTTMTWDKIHNMTENKKYFFIWQSRNSANIIPKRLLAENEILFLEEIKKEQFSKKK